VWKPIVDAHGSNWYAMIHVTSQAAAWLAIPLGAAFILAGVAIAPLMLRAHGRFARSMLAAPQRAELAERVEYLTAARSDLADTRAAEIRRIERDLHDGAQARLVAMGMTLSAAERALKTSPEAARALLVEARHSSVKALAELRDLIRGIHPPVLADRGLAEAVRARAIDCPIEVEVINGLDGRADAAVESAAYFAVSELLANVIKHAHAQRVSIDLRYHHGSLRIDVTDDGQGGADPSRGTGLRGVERRLAVFDGILAVSSPLGGPTMVTMELPCVLSLPKISSC
jgi:signal transduction histidine kinase